MNSKPYICLVIFTVDKQKTAKNNVFSMLSRPVYAAWSVRKYDLERIISTDYSRHKCKIKFFC